ncbi:MAG: ribonuclease P protein component [Alphaproteobacteria bacterium]
MPTLKTRAEFLSVKDGSKWAARSFVLQAKLRGNSDDAGHARFGFTAASRALGPKNEGGGKHPAKRVGAVVRNRAKRRLREAVRLLAQVHARPGYDYVIIARREVLHQRFADLLEDLQNAFGKVHRPPRGQDGRTRPRKGPRQGREKPKKTGISS